MSSPEMTSRGRSSAVGASAVGASAVGSSNVLTAFLFVILFVSFDRVVADEASVSDDDAFKAMTILDRNCGRCHKGYDSSFFDAGDVAGMIDDGYLVEGSAESSGVFERMFDGTMPPKNRPELPRPSGEEMELVRRWIDSGLSVLEWPRRRPVSVVDQMTAVSKHLRTIGRERRPRIRYLTLRRLHNDTTVTDDQLHLTRLALAKAVNSLSWEPEPVRLHALPLRPEGSDDGADPPPALVYAVDLDELGWDRSHWDAILREYPYAVGYESSDDRRAEGLAEEIASLHGSAEPIVIRADWFIATATSPPLYHTLLYDLTLPNLARRPVDPADSANPRSMTDRDLERFLRLDVGSAIRRGTARRSGFTESGVSGQNRLIERHRLPAGGAYWKSYDFRDSNRTASLSEFPLGPSLESHPHPDLVFEHDGGEIIFNLPNGLQAYLLVDGDGRRIDAGPIDVVGDALKTSGNEQIVAGVSCMACHRTGMIDAPGDEVRPFADLAGEPRRLMERLYPAAGEFRDDIDADRRRFLAALSAATDAVDADFDAESMPEPIGETARRHFLEPMTLPTVAAELDVAPERLRAAIGSNPTLREMGLRVLLREGGSLKRRAWESPTAFPLFKEVAREFGYSPRS